MNLGADLADSVVFADGIADGEALGQVERHRLLQVDVLAGLAGGNRDEGVPMRRGGNDDSVEVRLLKQLTEVAVALASVLELLDDSVASRLPDVAGARDDHIGLAGAGAEVGAAHGAAADKAKGNAAIGTVCRLARGLRGSDKMRAGDAEGGKGGGLSEEGAAGKRAILVHREQSSHG